MSTVVIKTGSTAAAAEVDVQVKLDPSLSAVDIELKQLTLNDDSGDADQNQLAEALRNGRKWICEHPGCGRSFLFVDHRRRHEHEHKLQAKIKILGEAFIPTRQSLDDRWPCPVPDCTYTCKTVNSLCDHIRANHGYKMKQQQQQQQQQKQQHRGRNKLHLSDVDDFYVNGARCGYHTKTGVFICYECRLVPECLLTHLEQSHDYDEKSIDNSILPESAVTANVNPNTNQHISNPHLASAISKPYQQQHPYLVPGWQCVTSDCGYCCSTKRSRNQHNYMVHHGEQILTVPALMLCLSSSKIHTPCFLVTRIDQPSNVVMTRGGRVSQYKLDCSHNGLNAQNENGDDVDQNETTEASNKTLQWKCGYPNCERIFNSSRALSAHQREHKLDATVTVRGNTYTLTRQSSDDRWTCPVPDCKATYKVINGVREHIRKIHNTVITLKPDNAEDDNQQKQQQKQQQIVKRRQLTRFYLKVDEFYINDTRCGYHTTTGAFICHKCKLVPECLLTHLQQKHGYDEESIDSSTLPNSAVSASADPNINQHTSNQLLASAISRPYRQYHQDIVKGWGCAAPDCDCCFSTKKASDEHYYRKHMCEEPSPVPALVLQLLYGTVRNSHFLITRLNKPISSVNSNNSASQQDSDSDSDSDDDDDDDDEEEDDDDEDEEEEEDDNS